MSCLVAILMSIAGLQGPALIFTGALLMGLVMAVFPALMQPTMRKVVGDDSLALGHFGSGCYWLSAQIAKLFGYDEKTTTVEDIHFPKDCPSFVKIPYPLRWRCFCATLSFPA